jgi:hypothetical protein
MSLGISCADAVLFANLPEETEPGKTIISGRMKIHGRWRRTHDSLLPASDSISLSCKSVDSLKRRLRRGWLRTASLRQAVGGRGGHALGALVHSELQIFRGRHDARAATQRGTRSRTTCGREEA